MRMVQTKIKLLTIIGMFILLSFPGIAVGWACQMNEYLVLENYVEVKVVSPTQCNSFQLKLLAFQATLVEGVVELTWETAAETTLSGYEIERSKDGEKFKKIAWVEAFGKAEGADYLYVDDPGEFKNRFRYRLKFVYKNKSFEYSEIRVARLPKILPRWD